MKAFKYLVFLLIFSLSSFTHAVTVFKTPSGSTTTSHQAACDYFISRTVNGYKISSTKATDILSNRAWCDLFDKNGTFAGKGSLDVIIESEPEPEPEKCEAGIVPITLKVPVSSGKMVCVNSCQYSLTKCVDVDFEAGMTCDGVNEGRECGTPKPTDPNPTPPVTQDPTNPTDKTDEQKTFENIMHVIGEKLDGIKDAITGGNQNQGGGDTGGSNGGTTGGDVTVNVDMSETNAKIDETNSLIDELTKWLEGDDLGDDIFGDSEPPEKELTPQQFDTNIFSGRAQCPADARLSFNLLGGKTFTKTFEFKDWCDNLEIFGALILAASYLYAAYIVSKA
ncbi:MAG: hypothetical protein DI631_09650 [Acinetobacter johnsonii]|nr:MAG: hypothetical protein DI631_09650 [Acinetobacter johnsonii]